jgi:S-DNA-T family DNA segregation ATPase FtsK/SpoIIIE
MPRKKKKEPITIKSSEFRILFGIIIFLAGLTITLSPFIPQQSELFATLTLWLGYSSIAWGILLIYLSFFLLTKGRRFKSARQAIGLLLFSACLSTLLSFWQTPEQLGNNDALRSAGGELGKFLHLNLNGTFGNLLEIIIILVLLILAFSLITGTTLEQIMEFVETPLSKDSPEKKGFSFKNIFPGINISRDNEEDHMRTPLNIPESELAKDPQIKMYDEQDGKRPDDEVYREPEIKQTPQEQFPEDIPDLQTSTTELAEPSKPKYTNWVFPSIDILQEAEIQKQDKELYKKSALVIEQTLKSFGIPAKVVEIAVGPTVLRFSLGISVGIKVSRIKNLSNDLALALASQTSSVRVEAPIPGTSYVGVEIPNPTPNYVYIRDMIKKLKPEADRYELPLILGKDITGKTVIRDLSKIPHLLVAGATGTGKSVGINSIITGLLMTKTPDEVKFIMIDPKMGVEMAAYNGIPHLLNPVITDMELVVNALQWTIDEMMRRYRQLKQVHAKKLTEYNKKMGYMAMPYIIVVIDEMADLMLTNGVDVETKIQRLAQMGRAVGVHLILATQRPTVNVITGLIKANVPGRMAFAVATAMDSRVILDDTGAETLLGNGDMLFKDQSTPKSIRIQCTYTSTEDTENVIKEIKNQINEEDLDYSPELTQAIEKGASNADGKGSSERDPDFPLALQIVINNQKASSSFLQRKMKIGYNKAARLIDELYEAGAIGPQDGSKPRQVLVSSVNQILNNSSENSNETEE